MEKDFEKKSDIIAGRNPVSEAVNSGRAIEHIIIARGELNGSIKVIVAKAKERKIPIKEVDRKKLDYMCGGAVHQGIAAVAAVKEYASVEDIFALAESRNEKPFIIVLDEIEDSLNKAEYVFDDPQEWIEIDDFMAAMRKEHSWL